MIIYAFEKFYSEELPICPKKPSCKCSGVGCFSSEFCSTAIAEGFHETGVCDCICSGCPGAVELSKKKG